jgi:thioredoxin-like negative regulator of GroEL
MKRTVEKAAVSLSGIASVGLVNIDENSELLEKFGVQGTPTMILVNKGEVVVSWTGICSAATIKRQVTTALQV